MTLLPLTNGHTSLTSTSLQTNIKYRHRAVNLFLRTYREYWLKDENVGQEVVIEDLTVSTGGLEVCRMGERRVRGC